MLNGIEDIDLTSPDAIEQINKLAEGMSNKNQELLGKISKSNELSAAERAKLAELEDFRTNFDIESAKNAEEWNQASELQKQKFEKENGKLVSELTNAQEQLKSILIDKGLSDALDGANVKKELKAGAVAMLQSGATIVDGKAMFGDKSLSEAVKEWSDTDVGKAYCSAPINSGGDATGGNVPASRGGNSEFEQRLKKAGLTK